MLVVKLQAKKKRKKSKEHIFLEIMTKETILEKHEFSNKNIK